MSAPPNPIARAFIGACEDELVALKPGNVHVHADGHRMTVDDFRRSAMAAAPPLTAPGARVGERIAGAVAATHEAVGTNTNLGIVLLCAPLAAAAEHAPPLESALAGVLAGLDRTDADRAFRAIVQSAPAGLGRAERHDVRAPATVTLRAAMAEAADRDRIARQYAADFQDVFGLGGPALARALRRGWERRWATLAVYLAFLSAFPDSHIVRKFGPATAEDARSEAAQFRNRLGAGAAPDELAPELLAWDRTLKQRGINPGTSADLTVATLFADRLRNILPPTQRNG